MAIFDSAPVLISKTAPLASADWCAMACPRTPSLLGTHQGARSDVEPKMWRDRTRRGRARQAFERGELSAAVGTTADSLAADRRRPQQDGQAAETKLPAENRSRTLDQGLGPTRARISGTGRLNGPARWPGSFKGGLDIPANSGSIALTAKQTPAPDVDTPRLFTRFSSRSLYLSSDNWILE